MVFSCNPDIQHSVPPQFQDVAKACISANCKSLMAAILGNTHLCGLVIEHMLQRVKRECMHLCEVNNFSSLLCKSNQQDLCEFSFIRILHEWKQEAPTFFAFLLLQLIQNQALVM